MISFILNNQLITTDKPEGMVLVDFIRYEHHMMGTKIGCREGDCGACTVLEGTLREGTVEYKSILSCLAPLGNVHGKHIVTIEGLEQENLSPVQQAMSDRAATQCGFCTPGFIMSLTAHSLKKEASDKEKTIASVSGNICRCTGYKSIELAAEDVNSELKNKEKNNTTEWLVKHGFVPEYFLTIAEKLKQIKAPMNNNKSGIPVGGGTDLFVQKADNLYYSDLNLTQENPQMKQIEFSNGRCFVGAAVNATEMMENKMLQQHFPGLKQYFKLISSEPVRNMGTLAGNIVNASPIADLVAFFLALDATVHLKKGNTEREIPLRELYKGYKQLDLNQNELIEKVSFKIPEKENVFNFEKVSKRTHLDIASVNTAIQLQVKNGTITLAHLSAGGVFAYPFYAYKTVALLVGKTLSHSTISEAAEVLLKEIAPISDIRGTKEYKSLLLRQLFFAHFVKLFPKEIHFSELIEQTENS
ncbi:MAG: FAD binding domain-containing protein [Bacteroidales bacterium]|nr:FAD binding domain-containing protein [Bacteroidales bacterium]